MRARVACALAVTALFFGCGVEEPGAGSQGELTADVEVEALLMGDYRIQAIFNECDRDTYYEADTSDPVGLLLPKLYAGRGAPLARAIEDLGRLGDTALPRLSALLAEQRNDPQRSGSIQNTIAALSHSTSSGAVDPLVGVLDHPQSLVRVAALRALKRHQPGPQHYERFESLLYLGQGQELTLAVELMFASDPERAGAQFVEWLEEDKFGSLEESLAQTVALSESDAVWAAALAIRDGALPRTKIWLDAGRAMRGDAAGALEFDAELADERPQFRGAALRAAIGTQAWERVAAMASNDPDVGLRSQAVSALGVALTDDDPAIRDLAYATLRRCLDGADPTTSQQARVLLLLQDDGEAVERTLAMLDGTPQELSAVLPTLRMAMQGSDRLAVRVEERVLERLDAEASLPMGKRLASYQALGLVPRASATERLLDEGRRAEDEGILLSGRRAFEWMTVHASNTGLEGRRAMYAALGDEENPLRRIDLIQAVASTRDELASEMLTEVVEDESLAGLERAYAASLLLNQGPVEDVAPRLERVALRLDSQARRAIQCLLHYWY